MVTVPAASRSPRGLSFLGKSDAEQKVYLPSIAKEELARVAASLGMTASEYARDVLLINLFGVETVKSVAAERLDRVAGIRPESAGGIDR